MVNKVFGKDIEEIIKLAHRNHGDIYDGVVIYDYENDELHGCSMFSNEMDNPANPHIEVFRLEQGERGEIKYECDECPYNNDEKKREECCIEFYTDEYLVDDFETNYQENVEMQIRDVITDKVLEDLDKLHDIHLKIIELSSSNTYYQSEILNDDFEMNILDELVDNAMEYGCQFLQETSLEILSGDIDYEIMQIDMIFDDDNDYSKETLEKLNKINNALSELNLDEALKV